MDTFPTSYPPQRHIPGITTIGRAWLAVLSCHSFTGPVFFIKLGYTPKMPMTAEGFKKVEMKRAGVPSSASKLFTYLFFAYNSWGDKRKNRTKKVSSEWEMDHLRRMKQYFLPEERGNQMQHVLFYFGLILTFFTHTQKELALFTVDFFFPPVDEITEA